MAPSPSATGKFERAQTTMTTARKLESVQAPPTDALRERYLGQTQSEAQAVLEMMAQVFDLGVSTFRSFNAPSPKEPRRLAPVTEGHDAIVSVDDDAIITSFSEAAEKTFDYPARAVIGRPVAILFESAGVSAPAIAAGSLNERLRLGIPPDAVGKRREGTTFAMEMSSTAVEIGGERRFVMVVRDVTERDRTESERRKAEARFRSLVEQIPAVTFMGSLNEDRNEFYVSPQIEALLGFSQEEWLSDPFLWFNQLHPDDRSYCNEEFARGCVAGGPFRAEFRALTRDGKVVWVHGEARVVRDEDGRPMFIQGVAYDITESKRAEEAVRAGAEQLKASLEEKDVLLKEIHHRVKNNLQVISSLLKLQATHIEDPAALEMFNESRHRIQTMALVHEKLYQSESFSRVDFGEYARSLSALLASTYRDKAARLALKTEIEEVSLGVDIALPLGLIINELISNSLKYAFPNGGEGEVRIGINRVGDDQLQLIVADNGIGFPADLDFRKTETLGMQLVLALTGQIGGSVELRSGAGTEFRILFGPRL
jgi:PAS domain S-box-containing protein